MPSSRRSHRRSLTVLAACGLAAVATLAPQRLSHGRDTAEPPFDPMLDAAGRACAPARGGPPVLLSGLVRVKTETAPFQPAPMKPAGGDVPLYRDLGALHFGITTSSAKAQAYFNQGLRLAFGFNHAEAQRAFQAAQRIDRQCAMCFWGEALILGPNINAPMMPEAVAPALAALRQAVALKDRVGDKERALIEALEKRYVADPAADRAPLDAAYADAMRAVAVRFSADDTVLALFAEAAMDTQPWDYWEAGGARAKGRGADIVDALEKVLKRNPSHPGAIHLYIHAVEASDRPERALPYARRLGALTPGAGHLVHMPAHIYYRIGMYRESLAANKLAIAVDERYFTTSPSDPLYKSAYYPHNIHFVMVSAQMGGDGPTAMAAAAKLDASIAPEVATQFAILEPVKAAPYTTHAQFAAPDAVLKLAAPAPGLVLVQAMYHYARATAFAAKKDGAGAQREIDALARLEATADFKPFDAWQVPAKQIVQTARLVATGRLADAKGDLAAAATAYEGAVRIEDELAYMEPPYWYYPVRQSLAAVRLRQGRLDDAEAAFRESLARVRNNGWALAGLAEVYRLKGDTKAQAATRQRFARAWFGPAGGPRLSDL
jgi:tetratricopeptide (TPR) repeat protein